MSSWSKTPIAHRNKARKCPAQGKETRKTKEEWRIKVKTTLWLFARARTRKQRFSRQLLFALAIHAVTSKRHVWLQWRESFRQNFPDRIGQYQLTIDRRRSGEGEGGGVLDNTCDISDFRAHSFCPQTTQARPPEQLSTEALSQIDYGHPRHCGDGGCQQSTLRAFWKVWVGVCVWLSGRWAPRLYPLWLWWLLPCSVITNQDYILARKITFSLLAIWLLGSGQPIRYISYLNNCVVCIAGIELAIEL